MADVKLSQQFYTNFNDVKHIFQYSTPELRAEILISELDFNFKSELVSSIDSRRDAYDVFDLIDDINIAIKLSYKTQYVEYVRNRFGQFIDNDRFCEFCKIIDIIRFEELVSFKFYLQDSEYNKQLFNHLDQLSDEQLVKLISQLQGQTLNYFCSKTPRLIKHFSNSRWLVKELSGCNQYRYIVYNLNQNEVLDCDFTNNLATIHGLIKYYHHKVQIAFLKWNVNSQIDLMQFLLKKNQYELAQRVYLVLDDNGKARVNQGGFAFYNDDYDLNTLDYYQLRTNIDCCSHEGHLINSLTKLDKSKIIELFEQGCHLDKDKAEKVLFNVFSVIEVIKICESNSNFTKRIITIISNQQILSQLSEYKWFWASMCSGHLPLIEISDIVTQLDMNVVLKNVHILDQKKVGYLFDFFYQSNKAVSYQIFENSSYKLRIVLDHKHVLNDMIDYYGFDYILGLGDNVSERRAMLEELPLKLAVDMINRLGLTASSEELRYLHGGRHKALVRRLNW
jgi:hypothetical protein